MLDGDDGTNEDDDAGERLASAYPDPDPEADLSDPETELPNVPSVEIPAPGRSEDDVPGELLVGFWSTVLLFNVALLATSVGVLLLAFDGQRRLGAGALVVGLLAAVRGYWKYRSLSERHRTGAWSDESGTDEPQQHERAGHDDERNG